MEFVKTNKKMLKQLGCMIILFALVASMLVLAPHTAVADTSGDYQYTTTGSPAVATITGYTGDGGAITIPSTLGGYPVAAIGDDAFYFSTSIVSVTIPNSVTTIGAGAFGYCMSLASVTIPNSVTTIGAGAFTHSYYLTSVTMGNGATSIGDNTFDSCHALTSVTSPSSSRRPSGTMHSWTALRFPR